MFSIDEARFFLGKLDWNEKVSFAFSHLTPQEVQTIIDSLPQEHALRRQIQSYQNKYQTILLTSAEVQEIKKFLNNHFNEQSQIEEKTDFVETELSRKLVLTLTGDLVPLLKLCISCHSNYELCLMRDIESFELDKIYLALDDNQIKYRTIDTPGEDSVLLNDSDIGQENGELYSAIKDNDLGSINVDIKNRLLTIALSRGHISSIDEYSRSTSGYTDASFDKEGTKHPATKSNQMTAPSAEFLLEPIDPTKMCLEALRTGDDRFYSFTSYVLDNEYRYEKDMEAIKKFDEDYKMPMRNRRFYYAVFTALKTVLKEVRYGLLSGYSLHQIETLPADLSQYMHSLVFAKDTNRLYLVDCQEISEEISATVRLLKEYESFDSFQAVIDGIETYYKDDPQKIHVGAKRAYRITETGIHPLEISERSNFLSGSDKVYSHLLLMRLKSLKDSLERSFVAETFGKDFSKEEIRTLMPRYLAEFYHVLSFYLPLDEQAFIASFWHVVERENLNQHFNEFRDLVERAEHSMLRYANQFVAEKAEMQNNLNTLKNENNEKPLNTLLSTDKKGVQFTEIPRAVRERMDKHIRCERRLSDNTPLTLGQRREGYRSFLKRQLCSTVPYNAADPEGTTLVFMALKHHNPRSYDLIYQRPCEFEQKNSFGISAKEYGLVLNFGLSKDELEKDILEEKLVLLEIFLRTYLENWSIEDERIKNRQNSESRTDKFFESFYAWLDSALNTRSKFRTRKEQAEDCLKFLLDKRYDLDGDGHKAQLNRMIKQFDFGIFDKIGLGSRLAHFLSKTAKEVSGLPLIRFRPSDVSASDRSLMNETKQEMAELKAQREQDRIEAENKLKALEEARKEDKAEINELKTMMQIFMQQQGIVLKPESVAIASDAPETSLAGKDASPQNISLGGHPDGVFSRSRSSASSPQREPVDDWGQKPSSDALDASIEGRTPT